MIILALTDLHGDVSLAEAVFAEHGEADLVLLLGDLTNFGRRDEAKKVLAAIRSRGPRVLGVLGNCDYPEVEDCLRDEGMAIPREGVDLGELGVVGVSGSLPCPGKTPNEFTEAEFQDYLDGTGIGLSGGLPLIFVSHQPPFDTPCDLTNSGEHVGSKAVRSFIVQSSPLVCFTGHIHEAAGIGSIGRTDVVNPGPLRKGGYVYADITRDINTLEIRHVGMDKKQVAKSSPQLPAQGEPQPDGE